MKYFLIVLVLAAALAIVVRMAPSSLPTQNVTIGTTTVAVEVASTEPEREQGLSGRSGLAEGKGMLFIFPQPGVYGFWMKDMQFNLDIIFAAADGTVVTVDSNLTPQSYKQTPPAVYYPAAPVMYALEVPAGFAAAHGIAEGSKLVVQ